MKERAAVVSAAIVALASLAAATVAVAQPAPAKPAPKKPEAAPPTATPPPTPRSSALVHVATEIAQAIGQVPPGALVVASPLTSDLPAPKGDELAAKIAAQIAGRLGVARAHAQPATIGIARGLSGRAASLVYVQAEIARGELRVTADLYPVIANGWDRLKNPVPGPQAHGFAGAPLDAEVRTYLSPVLLEQAKVHKAKHEEGDVLAIGCGDVDVDGGLELVVVSRTRVAIGKLRGGKLSVVRATPWAALASRVPVPLREPIATAVVSPRAHRGEIFVGTTDRAAVATDAMLLTRRQLTGLPIPGGEGESCAVALPDLGAFETNAVACAPPPKGEPQVVLQSPTPRFDAVATLDLVGKDGSVAEVVAAREPSGKLRLRRVDPQASPAERLVEATLENVGAQIALGDLDLDGVPEIVWSADAADDTLTVTSWSAKGPLVPRLKLPAKEGVRAVAVCPPEERGVPALVAVVGAEVWLVR